MGALPCLGHAVKRRAGIIPRPLPRLPDRRAPLPDRQGRPLACLLGQLLLPLLLLLNFWGISAEDCRPP